MQELKRKCAVCGKSLKILVREDLSYAGGHYFFGKGDTPGKGLGGEYWECNKCFNKWPEEDVAMSFILEGDHEMWVSLMELRYILGTHFENHDVLFTYDDDDEDEIVEEAIDEVVEENE